MKTLQKIKSKTPNGPTAKELEIQSLEQYDLTYGQALRFSTLTSETSYQYGKARSVERDGSIGLFVKGEFRSIIPERIQVKMTGPRGGVTWEPLVKRGK